MRLGKDGVSIETKGADNRRSAPLTEGNYPKGAAIGGAIGMMRSRNRSRQDAQQAAASKNYENQSNFQHQQNNFKKAMSICLEARGYSVR